MRLNHGERKLQEIELHELIIEALTHLKTLRQIRDYELYNAIPNFRRSKRFNAYSFEEGRSPRCRRSKEWLELQKSKAREIKI